MVRGAIVVTLPVMLKTLISAAHNTVFPNSGQANSFFINFLNVPLVYHNNIHYPNLYKLSSSIRNIIYTTVVFTRRKTFTHEKREQVGMDLVRSTEANRNHTGMHVIINTHPCNSLYKYSYYMHVYILYGPCLLFSN